MIEYNNVDHPFMLSHKDILFEEFMNVSFVEQIYTAIYVRVSTERQANEGTSLETQIYDCLEKAKQLGIPPEYIRIYKEAGQSGEDIDRPEMNRLREDVENGFIKNVIIVHPDRLSREMNGKLQVCTEIERNEVNLVFIDMEYSNTPEGQLFFNLLSSIAQYELEQIKKRTRKGIKKAVQQKKQIQPMRVPPFGYNLTEGKFVIIEEEAKYVGLIFQWYINGLTMKEIGEKLFEENVMPKRKESESWNSSSIQRILKNENYIGKYYYNRKKTKKVKGQRTKSGKPKRVYSTRHEEDWWLIDDPEVVPPLIDLETFYKAQSQRLANWKEKGQIKHEYLLARLLHCECCNIKFSPYTSQSQQTAKKTGETKKWFYRRYRCQNKNPRKYGGDIKKCPLPSLNANLLEEFIWDRFILNSICDVELLKEKIMQKEEEGQDPKLDEYNRLSQKLQDVKDEASRVQRAYQKGWKSEADTDKEMDILMNQEKELQLKVDKLDKELSTKTNVKLSKEQILDSALKIAELLKNGYELPFEIKKKIVNLLINEITISEGKNENEIIVRVIGVLDEAKIIQTTEEIKFEMNEDNSELLRYPRTQPQAVVNKGNVVNSKAKYSGQGLIHKDSQHHIAYVEYVAKINYITESGKNTKMKYRKSKFAIS